MNLINKEHADKSWLLGKKSDKKNYFKEKLASAVLLALLVILFSLEYSPAAAQEDFMISPDMASYIQMYHVTVDEEGVQ